MLQEIKLCTPGDAESIGRSITEFHWDTDLKSTISKWFARYEDLFNVDLKEPADDWKVWLLLRKLGSTEHDRYSNWNIPGIIISLKQWKFKIEYSVSTLPFLTFVLTVWIYKMWYGRLHDVCRYRQQRV